MRGAKGRGCLVTHVERRSRYVMVAWAPDQRAQSFNRATTRLFRGVPRRLLVIGEHNGPTPGE